MTEREGTYISDALYDFKTGHILIPLVPQGPSQRLYAVPHILGGPIQDAFPSVPGARKGNVTPQHQTCLPWDAA